MLLRKHIEGAFVASVEQVGFDRIMRLRLQHHGQPEFLLVLEIMGKHSNLILIDDGGKILGAVKHVGASVSRYRQVLPGRDYLPPPGARQARHPRPRRGRHWQRSGKPHCLPRRKRRRFASGS